MMKFKINRNSILTILVACSIFVTACPPVSAQDTLPPHHKSNFWRNVQFGGGLGLSIGSGYSDILIAPTGIYNLNQYAALGLGLQYGYLKQSDVYQSHIYGPSLIGLLHPIPEAQLSVELEQLRVNATYTYLEPEVKDSFWNTGLFLGAGYRNGNVTIGIRYNVLYKEANPVYSQAWLPFARVFF